MLSKTYKPLCLILASLALLPLPPLWGADKDQPFGLKAITPELTKSAWSQFLGVGLNILSDPVNSTGSRKFNTNLWYTTGKGNPFLRVSNVEPSNTHIIDTSYGRVTIQSEKTPTRVRPLTKSETQLTVNYDLTLPLNPTTGLAYLTISCNTPMPVVSPGQKLKLGLWLRSEVVSGPDTPLQTSGYLNTFGGDIFTEQPMRLLLSHQPPTMKYFPPSYQLLIGDNKLSIGPEGVKNVANLLRATKRMHSADSVRGLDARKGFLSTSNWQYVETSAFALTEWDVSTQIISFELMLQLPYSDQLQDQGAVWENVAGQLEVSGIQWWVEE